MRGVHFIEVFTNGGFTVYSLHGNSITAKRQYVECNKEKNTYECRGSSQNFCFNHLSDHRQTVNKQFHKIEDDSNSFLQRFIEQKDDIKKNHPLLQEIDKWKEDSIKKIKQTAEQCKTNINQMYK
jgi:hypothetical protein